MWTLEDFDYDLPPELIAQLPSEHRDHSRLLVADRAAQRLTDRHFYDLADLLRPGDLLVLNDTQVVPARLRGRKETGGHAEVLVIDCGVPGQRNQLVRTCLLRSSKRPRLGSRLVFPDGVHATVVRHLPDGAVQLLFENCASVEDLLGRRGQIPLPPYIQRPDDSWSVLDQERYQTVFSQTAGAIAAPTAGLHFTPELLARLKARDIEWATLTLHVGYGTFKPVRTPDIRDHDLPPEYFLIQPDLVAAYQRCQARGGRLVAVGTTVVRALETAVREGALQPGEGWTGLLITPGFRFKIVEALVTNFHLPKSSLLFLVAAFGGMQLWKRSYAWAVAERYRFFSYGDAMLLV